MEELSKIQYRATLICAKYIPWLIAVIYFIALILSCLGITFWWATNVFSLSLLPAICLIMFSILFKFCIWHRLPIYYVLFQNLINSIDFYIGIPVSNLYMILIYCIITGIFVLLGAYLKNKHNDKVRTT